MKAKAIFLWLVLAPVLTLSAAAAQQPGKSVLPNLPDGTLVFRDMSYVKDGHERQTLDLYIPESDDMVPLIIWIHGGAWLAGNKDSGVPVDYLNDGYAVATINYRLSQHAIFPAQIEDCKTAVRRLRFHAEKLNINPNRFGVWGPSAGGHLVAMLGTAGDVNEFEVGEHLEYSSRVQAVVDYFGPTDFLQMDDHRLPNGQVHNDPNSPESLLIGGYIQDNKDKVAKANPITYVTKDDAPFLIVHGDSDPLVPHHQSQLLQAALKEAGVPVTFYTVKGGGHGGFRDPNVPKLTKEFFDKHLKKTN